MNRGLASFADKQFDFVVLSQTLQAVLDVERVVADILRVGRQGIVSFPNLGYRPLREHLYTEGRAPRAGSLLGYNWYNSPNVRFLTLDDFDEFCREKGITIHRADRARYGRGHRGPRQPEPERRRGDRRDQQVKGIENGVISSAPGDLAIIAITFRKSSRLLLGPAFSVPAIS